MPFFKLSKVTQTTTLLGRVTVDTTTNATADYSTNDNKALLTPTLNVVPDPMNTNGVFFTPNANPQGDHQQGFWVNWTEFDFAGSTPVQTQPTSRLDFVTKMAAFFNQ